MRNLWTSPRRWLVLAGSVTLVALGIWHFSKAAPTENAEIDIGPVDYAHHVAPIVHARCSSCHRPGESAPFSLLSYDDVRQHARQFVDVTQKRFMPPWLPNEGHELFADSRRLTDRELLVIRKWVETRTPIGEQSQIPSPPTFADSWQTNPPDLVLETPIYSHLGQDRDVFRNFVVPIELDEPRGVQSIEIRPCNPRVTHHARLGIDSSSESIRRDAEDPEPGYAGMAWGQDAEGQLVIWAPGMAPNPAMPGVAWRLHPHMSLVLHTHMQPSGKPEVVKFRIGIRFAEKAPSSHPAVLRIGSGDINIPAGEQRHVVQDVHTLPIDVDLHTIFPHAHSLCREMRLVAELPDGGNQTLISISHFDENWHDSYRYRQPVRLPRGARLRSTFVYDNSDANVRNRNHPPKRVVYGSNVTDEMADIYLHVTPVHSDQRTALMEGYKRYNWQSQAVGYRRALELDPNNTWHQEGLAASLVALGTPGKAVEVLEQRLRTGPKEIFPIVRLGMALVADGKHSQAEARLREAIDMDGQNPLAWFGLGRVLEARFNSAAAEQAFRRVIELAPDYSEARLSLAELLLKQGKLDSAIEVCSEALKSSPDMSAIFLKLGDIYAKQKNYDESLECYKKAQRFAPYLHPPKVILAAACCANGDQSRGVNLLQEAREEYPQHPVPALMLGQLARMQRQVRYATECFALAAALPMPDNWPPSHKQRFQVLLHSERFQLAQMTQDLKLACDSLTNWLKHDPENKQARKIYDHLPAQPD